MPPIEPTDVVRDVTKGKHVPLRYPGKEVFPYRRLRAVPFNQVQITDPFWNQRLETNRQVSIPNCLRQCEDNRIQNFARAGHSHGGALVGSLYDDSDLYKIIEGAAYCLHTHADPHMESYLDRIVDLIASAQWQDGYLFTHYTLPQRQPSLRWTDLRHSHELYCAGHLIEAAIAYYKATGKRRLLDVAVKLADHIDATFGPQKQRDVPGHPEIEIALVRLYQLTGNTNYLKLSTFFLAERGCSHQRETYGSYVQDHKPVSEQREALGHAVRAMYLYSGMMDEAAATNNRAYIEATKTLWNDVVYTKLYITGGIGSRPEIEGFGNAYELPNETAYCETCAAIAFIMYNHRLFLFHKDAKYCDVLERTLYNNMISGVSLSGDSFFYQNVLASDSHSDISTDQTARRRTWYPCACCPTSIVRFIPTIPGYIYAQEGNNIHISLFINSKVTFEVNGQNRLTLTQASNYPWDGHIHFTVGLDTCASLAIKLRIPGWSRNKPLPSTLYEYVRSDAATATLRINGKEEPLFMEKGFAVLDRTWESGDTIDLDLPMPIRRVVCREETRANQHKVSLERGPLVYCIEGFDNGGSVRHLELADDAQLDAEYRLDLLNGINVIHGMAITSSPRTAETASHLQHPFLAIPYYAWGHRGAGEMAVWLNRQPST